MEHDLQHGAGLIHLFVGCGGGGGGKKAHLRTTHQHQRSTGIYGTTGQEPFFLCCECIIRICVCVRVCLV